MSDHDEQVLPEQVLEAGRERLAAFRPDRTPPFAALQARKRRRDLARGGGALGATALAVAGVVLVPGLLTGGMAGPSGQAAQGGAMTPCERLLNDELLVGMRLVEAQSLGSGRSVCLYADADVRTAGASPDRPVPALRAEVDRDGSRRITDTVFTTPPVDPGDAGPVSPLRSRDQVPFHVRYDPAQDPEDDPQYREPGITACLDRSGVTTTTVEESLPPKRLVVAEPDAADGLTECLQALSGVTVTAVPVVAQGPPQPEEQVAWTGAQVCVAGQDDQCRALGRDQARSLYRRLEAAPNETPGQAHCTANSTVYSVLFEHPSVKPIPFEVPYLCGPMTVGAEERVLDQAGRDAVRLAYETGNPDTPTAWTTGAELTAKQQAFVDSCVGPENAPLEPQYVGMSEAEANPPNSYRPYPTRIVGRDGDCLGRTKDLQGNRVNLIVEDGKVIWAGRF